MFKAVCRHRNGYTVKLHNRRIRVVFTESGNIQINTKILISESESEQYVKDGFKVNRRIAETGIAFTREAMDAIAWCYLRGNPDENKN